MKKVILLVVLFGLGVFSQASIPGDVNSSGSVDITDLSIFSDAWLSENTSTNWNPACDIPDTNDGIVNGLDFAILADHWLLTAPNANEMAFVPGGEYSMGDHFSEGLSNELPLHPVKVDALYVGKYEVTNSQYCAFLNAAYIANEIYVSNNSVYGSGNDKAYCGTSTSSPANLIGYANGVFTVIMKDGRDMSDDPVISVNWYGAAAYCNWRSEQEGYQACYNLSNWECDFTKKGHRLLTEAEWEYAARGGQHNPYYRFPWGDSIDGSMANYASSGDPFDTGTVPLTTPVGYYNGNQTPAGSDMANGYGLHDMAGNAYEWCNDWFDSGYYSISPYSNPTGPASGTQHILRGGSWNYADVTYCRTAKRFGFPAGSRANHIGFRTCLDLN